MISLNGQAYVNFASSNEYLSGVGGFCKRGGGIVEEIATVNNSKKKTCGYGTLMKKEFFDA